MLSSKSLKKLTVFPLVLRLVKTAGNIVLLQGINDRHIFLGQLKIERVEVGLDARSCQRLWQYNVATSRTPVDQDLSRSLPETLCDFSNTWIAQLVATSEWRVRLDLDVVLLAQRDEIFALPERMDFDLVHTGNDFSVLEETFEVLCSEVGDADRLYDS